MIAVRDTDNSRKNSMNWPTLRTYSIDWYRRQGIDFSELNRKFKVTGN